MVEASMGHMETQTGLESAPGTEEKERPFV